MMILVYVCVGFAVIFAILGGYAAIKTYRAQRDYL
jgi:hypothetical protein